MTTEETIKAAGVMLAGLKKLRAILCDPEGNPCFEGSDGDRQIAREVFWIIDALEVAP